MSQEEKMESQCESRGLTISKRPACPHTLLYFPVNLCSKFPDFLFKTHHLLPGDVTGSHAQERCDC